MPTSTRLSKVEIADLPETVRYMTLTVQCHKMPFLRAMARIMNLMKLRGIMGMAVVYVLVAGAVVFFSPSVLRPLIFLILVCANAFMLSLSLLVSNEKIPRRSGARKQTDTPAAFELFCMLGFPAFVLFCILIEIRSFNDRCPDIRLDARKLALTEVADTVEEWNKCVTALTAKFGEQCERMPERDRMRLCEQQAALWSVIRETHSHLAHHPLGIRLDSVPEELKKIDQARDLLRFELMDYSEEFSLPHAD